MSDLENIAAHALHNAFIVTQKTGLEWPHPTSVDFIEKGTIINVTEVSLRPTDAPYDPFEIWVASGRPCPNRLTTPNTTSHSNS